MPADNVELRVDIAAEPVAVMVKMLLINIGENRNLGRGRGKFELMRRHLDNRYRLGRDRVNILKHGNADISYEACVKSALLKHIVNQRGGCGFSLGACYAYLAARRKF